MKLFVLFLFSNFFSPASAKCHERKEHKETVQEQSKVEKDDTLLSPLRKAVNNLDEAIEKGRKEFMEVHMVELKKEISRLEENLRKGTNELSDSIKKQVDKFSSKTPKDDKTL